MASNYEAPIRKPLVIGDKGYHDVTVDIAAPVEGRAIFAEETGSTPLNWLTGERVTRAAELLESGGGPTGGPLSGCGVCSPPTFPPGVREKKGGTPPRPSHRRGARLSR